MSRRSILIIDDDAELTELLNQALSKNGFNVICSHKIIDAQTKLQNQVFSIILLDLRISEQSGIKILQQLRAKNAKHTLNHSTPVLIMSGHLEANVIKQMAGYVQGILAKPFKTEDLNNQISALLNLESVVNSNQVSSEKSKTIGPTKSEFNVFLHDFSGKLMVIDMLVDQLKELVSKKTNLEAENKIILRVDDNLKKLTELIELVRTSCSE